MLPKAKPPAQVDGQRSGSPSNNERFPIIRPAIGPLVYRYSAKSPSKEPSTFSNAGGPRSNGSCSGVRAACGIL